MKQFLASILNSSPTSVASSSFDEFRGVVSIALQDALDVPFSESESMVISHAIVGILSARKPHETFGESEELIQKRVDNDKRTNTKAFLTKQTSAPPRIMKPKCASRRQPGAMDCRNHGFSLMDLDGPSILPNILTFLPYEDLNNLAVCCRRLTVLRSDPKLDQTRTGVITFRSDLPGNGWNRLMHTLMTHDLSQIFRGNRTTLRLKGFVKTLNDETMDRIDVECCCLTGVKTLDLSHEQRPENPYIDIEKVFSHNFLGTILPHVQSLNVSHSDDFVYIRHLAKTFPNLCSITAKHSELRLLPNGDTLRNWHSLKELFLEGNCIVMSPPSSLQFGMPPNLEKLDIRHVRGIFQDPIPTKDLLGLLHHNLSLRWLRCDVCDEDLPSLQEAHPDVAIVNC